MKCDMGVECEEDDARRTYGQWQKGFAAGSPNITMMQDTAARDAWNSDFGCGHDDLIVYDRFRTVAQYLPSQLSRAALDLPVDDWLEIDLKTEEGKANVKAALLRASEIDSDQRCRKPNPGHITGDHNPEVLAGIAFAAFGVALLLFSYCCLYKRLAAGKGLPCVKDGAMHGAMHVYSKVANSGFEPVGDDEEDGDWNARVSLSSFEDDNELDDDDLNGDVELRTLGLGGAVRNESYGSRSSEAGGGDRNSPSRGRGGSGDVYNALRV
jgi:hypothetical protein